MARYHRALTQSCRAYCINSEAWARSPAVAKVASTTMASTGRIAVRAFGLTTTGTAIVVETPPAVATNVAVPGCARLIDVQLRVRRSVFATPLSVKVHGKPTTRALPVVARKQTETDSFTYNRAGGAMAATCSTAATTRTSRFAAGRPPAVTVMV